MTKVFEVFSGIGSQRMALKKIKGITLSDDSLISEWFIDAILAYKKIHYPNENLNLQPTAQEILNQFNILGISKDSKNPHFFSMNEIIKKYDYYRKVYEANIITNNKGSVVNIAEWDHDYLEGIDLLTYSFPCQDLSTAGKMNGLNENSETRSSLLWKIKDLLNLLANNGIEHPKILLMENVSVISSKRYSDGLNRFKRFVREMGYVNIPIHLNAKDCGSIQNRKRYFLISIRNDLINIPTDDFIREFNTKIKKYKTRKKYSSIRSVVPDIFELPTSSRNDIYENQLQNLYQNEGLDLNSKLTNVNQAYPTFNQAKVVLGLDYKETPTVTFQGEFSKIRFFDIIDGTVVVRRANSIVNWKLMGFPKKYHDRLVAEGFSDNKISSLSGNSITLEQLTAILKTILSMGVNEWT